MAQNIQTGCKIIGICGSLRKTSFTRYTVNLALKGAKEVGPAETELIDLRDYDLPFCDGRAKQDYPADVHKLRKKISEADGIILGSPEYHGNVSGVLKNALDLMGFDEFEGKIVGLVGVGGGSLGAINSLNTLRVIGRWLHAWVIPQQVSIPNASKVFDEEGAVGDKLLEERIIDVGKNVARFTFMHSSKEIKKFLDEWEKQGQENPGGTGI